MTGRCDYHNEAAATKQFKRLMQGYPEFAVPAVVPGLSSQRVLTTEWMEGVPIDRAAKCPMAAAERDRVGSRLLWLSLTELFSFRFMQAYALNPADGRFMQAHTLNPADGRWLMADGWRPSLTAFCFRASVFRRIPIGPISCTSRARGSSLSSTLARARATTRASSTSTCAS